MEINRNKPVMVTGATGYIASWLVKYLLEDGLTVHATVRQPDNPAKVGHLTAIADEAPGTLKLFQAHLLDKNAFDAPMEGCELVIHTASPFVTTGITDPESQLIAPALEGTRNVMEAVNRCESVKRVVLTSSVVGIYGDAVDMQDQGLDAFTEEQWNTTSRADHQPYNYSKVVAEKLAWELCEAQDRWDMLTINPSFVLGPSLTKASDSTSLSIMKGFGRGQFKTGVPMLSFGVVDVRDVAMAHFKAGFTANASGRHICNSESLTMLQIAQVLRQEYGSRFKLPGMQVPKWLVWLIGPTQGYTREFISKNVGYPLQFDNSYIRKDLNMEFRPAADTVVAHFEQMIADGIIR